MPYGPKSIGPKGQIALPKELMEQLNLGPGHAVYVMANDSVPGTLLVVPQELVADWSASGLRKRAR